MAGIFKKIGKGLKNAAKFVGKNAKILAPVAAIGALAIPGIGGVVGTAISKVSSKIGKGKKTVADVVGGLPLEDTATNAASGSGRIGLFGKGGFLGLGNRKSKEAKWEEKDQEELLEAGQILHERQMKADKWGVGNIPETVENIVNGPKNLRNAKENSEMIKYLVGGFVVAKILKIF